MISDACGDVSEDAYDRAMERMKQAGVMPMTALQYLLEPQRDRASMATIDIAKAYGGA